MIYRSGVIWQLDKGKKKQIWKTLNNSVIVLLEKAYQEKKKDIRVKDLVVSPWRRVFSCQCLTVAGGLGEPGNHGDVQSAEREAAKDPPQGTLL